MSIPDIRITQSGTASNWVIEEILAVLVDAGMLTVSGDIGGRINERVAELRLNDPKTGDTV